MFSQKIDRSLIMNVGVSDNGDLSALFGGRFIKNVYGAFEYAGNQHVNKKNMLVALGLGTKRAVILVKGGACYLQNYDLPPTYHPNPPNTMPKVMETKFDYGLEYLWINNNTSKVTLLYGLSYTHMNGVEFKFGAAF